MAVNTERACPLDRYCNKKGDCQNFTSFSELGFDLCLRNMTFVQSWFNQAYVLPPIGEKIPAFKFLCIKNQLILNRSFDMTGLLQLYKEAFKLTGYQFITYFYNLAGVDLTTSLPINIMSDFTESSLFMVIFQFSKINFFFTNQSTSCRDILPNQTIANVLNPLLYLIQFSHVKFEKGFCVEVFRNLSLNQLVFEYTNTWNLEPKRNANEDLNINIQYLYIFMPTVIKFVLDPTVLNSDLLSRTYGIILQGTSLYAIRPLSLFKDMTRLRSLSLKLSNQKSFLHHSSDVEWMTYLNYNITAPSDFWNTSCKLTGCGRIFITMNMFNLYFGFIDDAKKVDTKLVTTYFPFSVYYYPEEDFCLFVNFPHAQLVVTIMFRNFSDIEKTTTCTMVWLLQYVYNNYKPNGFLRDSPNWPNFNDYLKNCSLEYQVSLCNITQTTVVYHDAYFDSYDLKVGLDWVQLILLTYMGPPISLFGVLSNSIIIAVILYNKLKYKNKQMLTVMNKNSSKQLVFLLDEPLYKYMLINSILSEIYCLFYLFDLSIPCTPIPFYDGIISNFKQVVQPNCLNKDMAIAYLTSVIKLTSNIMILEMSINRYILLGKDHVKFILKLAQFDIKKLFIITLVFSSLLSIVPIFQQLTFSAKSFNYKGQLMDTDYSNLQYVFSFLDPSYFSRFMRIYFSGMGAVLVFSIIYHQVAYTLFCLISLIIDIVTIKRFKKVLDEHIKISKGDDEAKKKRAAEMKSFVMVIAFNLTNFILRLPDILSSLVLIIGSIYPNIFYNLCITFNRCLAVDQLTNFFYIFSLSINFFLYFSFYSTFRDCFTDFFEYARSKFRKLK